MKNSAKGKTYESKCDRIRGDIVYNSCEDLHMTASNIFETLELFGENLAALSFHRTKMYWNERIIISATKLDLF